MSSEYTIFIGDNCHECAEVQRELKKLDIEVDIFNIDHDSKRPPIQTFAYPAIFKGNILLAYGSDIISYLKSKIEA